ncbi:hypothetical protein DSC45_23710 [Streptomyces sp. YIM 130001]|uniref:Ig-like domain-containing protein n=1 Tax=Streptomyces sp. YIM 130001 TaxID=2259644 RepID=UPI000E647FEF|nr:Ig-like domain-containing protein [Streptomyces sp. YIM 130001]RII13360.1 hypothetical protein DSC45_23710 [Streptomyces sp. YIM 130001]
MARPNVDIRRIAAQWRRLNRPTQIAVGTGAGVLALGLAVSVATYEPPPLPKPPKLDTAAAAPTPTPTPRIESAEPPPSPVQSPTAYRVTAGVMEISTEQGQTGDGDPQDAVHLTNVDDASDVENLDRDVTLLSVGRPDHGTAKVKAGAVVYTPEAGFAGSDVFSYTVKADGKKHTGRVRATVYEPVTSGGSSGGSGGGGGPRACAGTKHFKACL